MKKLSVNLLTSVSSIISKKLGIHFPVERHHDLRKGLKIAAEYAGYSEPKEYAEKLAAFPLNQETLDILSRSFTVGETYFFREQRTFELLTQSILPQLIQIAQSKQQKLRIWSAGCCTGEEPYSLAILLDRFFPELKSWDVQILGTDLNPVFLEKARKGVYTEWSFRQTPSWLKSAYFEEVSPENFSIAQAIRKKVKFSQLNLMESSYPFLSNTEMEADIILCRNVLMYFSEENRKAVFHRFYSSLSSHGWLIIDPPETSNITSNWFEIVQHQNTLSYKKKAFSTETSFSIPHFSKTHHVSFLPESEIPDMNLAEESKETMKILENLMSQHQQISPISTILSPKPSLPQKAESKNYNKKEDSFRGNVEAEPDILDPEYHYLHAIFLQEKGDLEESALSLKRALFLDPDLIVAHYALGHLARKRNNPAEAERHFRNTLDLLDKKDPQDTLPHSEGMLIKHFQEIVRELVTLNPCSKSTYLHNSR